MEIQSFVVLIRQLKNRLFVCRRDFFPNTHIGLFILYFMGFDAVGKLTIRTPNYVGDVPESQLRLCQILSESGLVRRSRILVNGCTLKSRLTIF